MLIDEAIIGVETVDFNIIFPAGREASTPLLHALACIA
jgi:hypothetical protein